jgi:adenylyl cyclase-associated protein
MVSNLFVVNRSIVLCAAACKKPSDTEMDQLLKPMVKDFDGISSIKDKNRNNREFGLNFQVVADGIGCVGWVQLVGHLRVISIDL